MAKRLHDDNQGGDSDFGTGSSVGGIALTDIPPTQVDETTRTQQTQFNDLPANQQSSKRTVNWLGSSYSGADIKVVAHLYDSFDHTREIEDLERQIREADEIATALDTMTTTGLLSFITARQQLKQAAGSQALAFNDIQNAWLAAAGVTGDQIAARKHMRAYLLFDNFSTAGGITLIKYKMIKDQKSHENTRDSLQDRLDQFQELDQEGSQTVVLAALQTISVQSHREKYAVRALGHSYVKGYSRGPRTIAGSMIFTVFNEHSLLQLMRSVGNSKTYGELDPNLSTLIPDQLPPLDLTVAFANEYGAISELRLFGVEFVNDGTTYSIEDLLTENIINFVCRDADVLTSHGAIRLSRLQADLNQPAGAGGDTTGSSLLFSNERYGEYLDKLGVRRRLRNR